MSRIVILSPRPCVHGRLTCMSCYWRGGYDIDVISGGRLTSQPSQLLAPWKGYEVYRTTTKPERRRVR